MGSSGGDEEEPALGPTKDTDREVRKSQEPQSLLPMEFVTRMLQDGVNLHDLLEESQEREENQAKITLEEPHRQKQEGSKTQTQERGRAKRSKSSMPTNPRHQKPDLKNTEIGAGRMQSRGRNPTDKRQEMRSTDIPITQKPR